jgi:hypothetical protein
MISFENYFWDCRIKSYGKKVLNGKFPIRKLINRCQKVNWDKMEEVSKLKSFQIYTYLENNHDLLEKLWKLEFGVSIHS